VPYLRHFISIWVHKYFVFLACVRVGGIPFWRWFTHDMSKFSRAEFGPYTRQFHGARDRPLEFARAWRHHYAVNKHHWNYWRVYDLERLDYDYSPMPEPYIREMVADWLGAGRTYTGSWDMTQWIKANFPKTPLHPETRAKAEKILYELGYTGLYGR